MSESSAGRGEVSIEFSVLLWCMRVFVDPPGQDWAGQDEAGQDGAEAHIEATLRRMGAADAAPAFCRFMAVIRDTLPRTAKVSRVRWRSGGNDEHVLLEAIALAQQRRAMEALLLLRGLLPPAAARIALDNAEELGAHLARAGWFLGAPAPGIRHFAMAMQLAPGRPRADAVGR
jgi:hypothetical protein